MSCVLTWIICGVHAVSESNIVIKFIQSSLILLGY